MESFLTWCVQRQEWCLFSWVTDRRNRLPEGTAESLDAYVERMESNGYGAYTGPGGHVRTAWGQYRKGAA